MVKILGEFADIFVGLLPLYIWYAVAGTLLASWTFMSLSVASIERRSFLINIFGVLILIGIIIIGVVDAYIYSFGFKDPIKTLSLVLPAVLIVAQGIIFGIVYIYRKHL